MPTPFYPDREAHYLTEDGDVLDSIAYSYYRQESNALESVLLRNPWLSKLSPILPAGLIIVLPVIDASPLAGIASAAKVNASGLSMRKLWQYRVPKLWKGSAAAAKTAERLDAEALSAYRSAQASINISTTVINQPAYEEPLEFDDFDYLAIYYQDETGKWKLGRIHKSNVKLNSDGYGYSLVGGDVLGGALL